MDLFLAHSLLLIWASIGAARKLAALTADRLLAAALLAWGNIVVTSLVLSCAHKLGEPKLFFGTSLLLATLTVLTSVKIPPVAADSTPVETDGGKPDAWLAVAFILVVVPLAGANAWLAATYLPGGDDALSYHLPRAMFYLGQDSLAHFDASDLRQTRLPFNFNLLQVFGLVYGPPLQVLNLFGLTAWAVGGLAVYRLCRRWVCGANASLLTSWLALAAPPVLANASSSAPDLAAGAALVCAGVFALQWKRTVQLRHALLAGLAAGLAAGSSLGLFLLAPLLLLGAGWMARKETGGIRSWILPALLAFAISAPFALINLAETGEMLKAGLMLRQWHSSGLGEFLPALLLLGPGVARLIEMATAGPPARRATGWVLALAVALAATWSGGTDLLTNPGRPLPPLLKGALVPPGLPTLPLLLEFRLKDQPRVNIDTDGVDECIFPLMAQGHHERFTSRSQVVPGAYHLLSRSGLSRNASFRNAGGLPSYTLVPIPAKRTAGVEFLATIGAGPAARDYFGLVPRAGENTPYDSNRNLLVTLYHDPQASGETTATRITIAGLNSEDRARLVVTMENTDGRIAPLATFGENGEARVTILRPFSRLFFRVLDAADGSELGATALAYTPPAAESQPPIDVLPPTGASSLFVFDAVASRNSNDISCEGLLPVVGPFPQWNLPYIRWAKQPSVRLKIPATDRLARLVVSFSVQPQVRPTAGLDVRFNGKLVGHYELKARTAWLDQTLELVPQAGENVLEFDDATFATEPDWQDYLQRYPDVQAHLETNKIPLETGAREHFESRGRAEGRTVQMRASDRLEPAPQSYYFIYRSIRLEGFKKP